MIHAAILNHRTQSACCYKGLQYYLRFEIDEGVLQIAGATVANETDYDYPLPFRIDGYDAFGGIYRGDLNLQVYFPDDEVKLNRFMRVLDATDYILIPTSHQYSQITRVPERYPRPRLLSQLIDCRKTKIAGVTALHSQGIFKGDSDST
jgi:hypothetical protein